MVRRTMARLNIFVSFEFDRDGALRGNFYGQARRHSRHRIRNSSLNQDYPDEDWKSRARHAIRECDVVLVIVGRDTHNAPGVLIETDMARSLGKPTIQVLSANARRRGLEGVPHIENRIPWKWDTINDVLDGL